MNFVIVDEFDKTYLGHCKTVAELLTIIICKSTGKKGSIKAACSAMRAWAGRAKNGDVAMINGFTVSATSAPKVTVTSILLCSKMVAHVMRHDKPKDCLCANDEDC